MADKGQLEKLKRDVDAWNLWRIDNGDKEIDLIGADLSNIDLRKANLSGANLIGAFLSRVDLNNANLNGANLIGAFLNSVDLNDANLSGTNFIYVYLKEIIFKNTKYNKDTKWPEGFDPKKVGGLVSCDYK